MSGIRRFPAQAKRMTRAAEAFLASLEPEQRAAATAPYDVADHRSWTYLPGPRPGLMLADMTEAQQTLALELLDTGCSPTGARTARGIIELDAILRGEAKRGQYWVRIHGEPSGAEPWAWRVSGHHLVLHLTVVDDGIAVTPNFFGAEPATVLRGAHRGLRTLPDEEELARALLSSLDPEQRRVAVAAPVAPPDILTRSDPVADPGALAGGLDHAHMSGQQRDLLRQLIARYVDRVPVDVAASYWQDLTDAGLERITFRWAGPDERGAGHYYAVNGPTFLIEYDNTQDNANHIHSVWRHLKRDWGEDLLAAHYATHHRR